MTSKLLIIETAIYPPEKAPRSFSYDVGGLRPVLHPLAYVENSLESKEAVFNWFLPGIESLKALLRNVGFDRIKVFPATEVDRAILACHKREPYADSHAASYLNATLTLASGPARCKRDEVVKYSIRAENRGFARWLKQGDKGTDRGAVRLGAHLLTANDEVFSWYHAGTFLTKEVIPGEVAELEMALRAPATPGTYVIEFDMVAEHVSWFEDQGSRTLRHELTVE